MCSVFQFRQACNFCRAHRTSIKRRKIQLQFLIKWLGKGFKIPAYDNNRIFEVKSVVGFYRDSLLIWIGFKITLTEYFTIALKWKVHVKKKEEKSGFYFGFSHCLWT